MVKRLEHLSSEERLRVGVVPHREEKATGRPCCRLIGTEQQAMGLN